MHRSYAMPIRVAFGAMLAVAGASGVSAQLSRHAVRKSQPVPVTRTAPDVTATIPTTRQQPAVKPQAAKPTLPVTRDFGETLPKPFDLPSASRPRMRACGEKWQAVKLSGRAGSDTWREFAEKCLTERDGTAKKAAP